MLEKREKRHAEGRSPDFDKILDKVLKVHRKTLDELARY